MHYFKVSGQLEPKKKTENVPSKLEWHSPVTSFRTRTSQMGTREKILGGISRTVRAPSVHGPAQPHVHPSFQAPASFPLTERQFIKRTPRPLRTPIPVGRHAFIPTSHSGYTR